MPTQEQLRIAQETLETRRQIEEIVGSSAGSVKTDYTFDSEEIDKNYANLCEERRHAVEKLKKYRPLSIAASAVLVILGIVLFVLEIIWGDDVGSLLLGAILSFLGTCTFIILSPKLRAKNLTKQEYFDNLICLSAKQWLEEAKKNSYYFDMQEQAIAEKYKNPVSLAGPTWRLLAVNDEFTVLRRNDTPVINSITFQTDNISGIAILTKVSEDSRSVRREDYFHNAGVTRESDKHYVATTQTTQTTKYAVSLSFTNRVNPYSLYVGENQNLLLTLVNLFEQLTGLEAIRL